MKSLIILSLCILFYNQHLIGQGSSPIGKWVLEEHFIYVPIDTIDGMVYSKDTNIYHNQFEVSFTYKPNGEYIRQIGNRIEVGEWEMKPKGKKYQFLVYLDNKLIAKSRTMKLRNFDFEDLHVGFTEYIPEFGDYCSDKTGGFSYYKRVKRAKGNFPVSLLIGKWINPSMVDTNGVFFEEFQADKTYIIGSYNLNTKEYAEIYYTSKWQISGQDILIFVHNTDIPCHSDSDLYHMHSFYIEKLEESNFIYSYYEGRLRPEFIHMKKLEQFTFQNL